MERVITQDEAMAAVERFELMAFFNTVSPGARLLIAEELMAMVNWPAEKSLRNGMGLVPYVDPHARLDRLMKALRTVSDWPGMGEIRGLYCRMYRPADGIENPTCNIPGFTDEEREAGVDYLTLNRAPEPRFLPSPGDEPIGEELNKQLKQLVAAKSVKGEKE